MKTNSFAVTRRVEGGYDFVIAGVALAERLRRHEGVAIDHVSALGVVEGARARLLLAAEPDLGDGATAVYVCGMCGGYDGNPIGARIRKDGDLVHWDSLGYHYDTGQAEVPFAKVRAFCFRWPEYERELLGVAES